MRITEDRPYSSDSDRPQNFMMLKKIRPGSVLTVDVLKSMVLIDLGGYVDFIHSIKSFYTESS